METPNPPNDTPGALKQVVLTTHDIPWSLRGNKIQLGWKWTNIWNHHLELIPLLNLHCPKNPNPSKEAILRSPKHPCVIQVQTLPSEGPRILRVEKKLPRNWVYVPKKIEITNFWNHHWLLLWFLWNFFGGRGNSCRPNNATGHGQIGDVSQPFARYLICF